MIGDSLVVGIGCIEQFDATKDSSVPMALVENTAETTSHSGQGPVFHRFWHVLSLITSKSLYNGDQQVLMAAMSMTFGRSLWMLRNKSAPRVYILLSSCSV